MDDTPGMLRPLSGINPLDQVPVWIQRARSDLICCSTTSLITSVRHTARISDAGGGGGSGGDCKGQAVIADLFCLHAGWYETFSKNQRSEYHTCMTLF